MSGINTYTGSTTIEAGTFALTGAGSVATSSQIALATGGTFDIQGVTTAGGASITTLADSASGQAGTVNLGTKTLTITSGGSTFSGSLNGTGNLIINGGDQTLAGVSNSFTGATTIKSGGTLTLAAADAIQLSAVTINTGGTLALGSDEQSFASLTLNGGTLAGGALSGTVTSTTGGTISSVGGTAAVNATGGTTTFTGSNTYSGTTTASGTATLAAGGANALSANSEVSLAAGTTLDLGSANQTIGALVGSGGTVASQTNPTSAGAGSTAVLTVGALDTSTTFNGVIANGQTTQLLLLPPAC